MGYETLVTKASEQLSKAKLLHGSAAGAAIQFKDGNIATGFNIENRVQKGYHAEEVAIISGLKMGYSNNDFEAIAIVYGGDSDAIYPACACCRQMLWEYTNPNLIIVAYNIKTQKGSTVKLVDLYPLPYPMPKVVTTEETLSKTGKKGKDKSE